ncbi:MAG TPA: hypothetical protein VFM18_17100 [Methanosarcina sp.]|nr:hypothetical protein [Methanosarcina sp.]
MTYKYSHVEDYIEIMAGYREISGKALGYFGGSVPISLARYDMKVVPSLADQSMNFKRGYTDRQAKLATELVLKYERQFAKLGVDIDPVRTPQYRLPIRSIDRAAKVWVEDDTINLKFPYNTDLITQVRSAAKESKGTVKFNREKKIQELSLTEWNVNWAHSFAAANGIEIDSSLQEYMDMIVEAEKVPYAIELIYENGEISITNAPESMVKYITEHHGGINANNILTLLDLASIFGYTISPDIKEQVIPEMGTRFWDLCTNNKFKVNDAAEGVIEDIVRYATAANRFPIFVYEPSLTETLLRKLEEYFPDQILILGNKRITDIDPNVKIIYATKIPRQPFERIPLMISTAGLLHGGDRQVWVQTAEKIVYFSRDVYNKNNNKGPRICELN